MVLFWVSASDSDCFALEIDILIARTGISTGAYDDFVAGIGGVDS